MTSLVASTCAEAWQVAARGWSQSSLAVEDKDEGVHPLVEGSLGYHQHPREDQLYCNGDYGSRLAACCIHDQQAG
jgi:hypothetical protein